MGVIYTEAFESIPSWFGAKGTVVAGRTGNACSLTGTEAGTTATAVTYSIPSGDRSADTTVDLWVNMSLLGTGTTRVVCQLSSPAGTPAATVAWSGAGFLAAWVGSHLGGSLITGTNPTFTVNTWHRITLNIVVADTGGTVTASLDGTQFATTTADTKPGAATVVESFTLWGNGTAAGINRYDDLTLTVPTVTFTATGTGAVTFAGTGTAVAAFTATGTGAVTFAGSATASTTAAFTGTGTGAIVFAGTGTARVGVQGDGHITFDGYGDADIAPHLDVYAPPEWSWQVLDPPTGAHVGTLLAATARKLTFQLDGPASATFTMPGEHPETSAVAELATDVIVARNGRVLFRGRVGGSTETHSAVADTVDFAAVDYRGMLAHRVLWPTSTLVFTAADQSDIAWQLLADAQTLPGGNLGVTRGVGAVTGVTRDRTYTAGLEIGQAVAELGNIIDGFDWDIDAYLAFNLYHPRRGRTTGAVLVYGRDIVAVTTTVNPDRYGNAVYYTGAMPATTPETAVSAFPTGIGRWDIQKADPNLVVQSTVAQQAAGELADVSQLVPAFTVTLAPDRWNPYELWVGDTVRLVVQAGRLDIDVTRRIVQIDVTLDDNGAETVVLAVGAAPARLSERLNSLDDRISALELQPEGLGLPGDPETGADGGGGLYASLTGPGETDPYGELTQAGGFTVTDAHGGGIALYSGQGATGGGADAHHAGVTLTAERYDAGTEPDDTVNVVISSRNFADGGFAGVTIRAYDVGKGGIVLQSGANVFPVNPTADTTDLVASKDVRVIYGYGLDPAVAYGSQAALVLESGQITKAYGPVHIYVTAFHPNDSTSGVTARAVGDLCIDTRIPSVVPGDNGPNLWQATAAGTGNWVKINP